MVRPIAMMVGVGSPAPDGLFDNGDDGERWLAFEQENDCVFWQPRRGTLATYSGRAFALGEDIVDNPGTYAFDCALNIFSDPVDWLRAKRDGIVALDWSRAFDRLRHVPRIAIAETLLPLYKRHMRPPRMPELFIIPGRRQAA
ncbi:hypothetical protein KEU06_28800 [Pseudaminobacter sp. 19-2017]|uniref:Uncharacterized protein n=1 Tax=Pseudaminobacter soli (ex Zhang et al. 2022) TaxID=2831468 RepID=A0A942I567_9HYPH|nr:hypothetical protein [Pseudaminobacter soli]MBS3652579.1 hypothetical protein [Pseudaminobacter soli]